VTLGTGLPAFGKVRSTPNFQLGQCFVAVWLSTCTDCITTVGTEWKKRGGESGQSEV